MLSITIGQYEIVYNALSLTVAAMSAATLFFWLSRDSVAPRYRMALVISGVVTFIAAYHYWRIFGSWTGAFVVDAQAGTIALSNEKFNDAYRYVDWILTVPLLLVELIIVMGLSRAATISKSVRLGLLALAMVVLGYPGEVAGDIQSRLLWGGLSMIPFLFIVFELAVGLRSSIASQPESARGLVKGAIVITIGTWAFYPVVFFAPLLLGAENSSLATMSGQAATIVQVGYTIADILAKAGFGILIYLIASAKSEEWASKQDELRTQPN
ncbi:MAG: bacteriorhodopsin-like [Caulobacterales bacterium]|jgi:bacteriorhodopsin